MIKSEDKIKVRYDEVDKMGYVYHGNYARYYHISRTELLRKVGICDKELESFNIILPVIEMHSKYLKPIFYDDIITIETSLMEMPKVRMKFKHMVFNQNNELINEGTSILVFVDADTRAPMIIPELISKRIENYLDSSH